MLPPYSATLAQKAPSAPTRANLCPLFAASKRSRRRSLFVVGAVTSPSRHSRRTSLPETSGSAQEHPQADEDLSTFSLTGCPGGSSVTLGAGWACLSCGVGNLSLPCSWFKIISGRCVLASRRDAACRPEHERLQAWIVNHGPWVP